MRQLGPGLHWCVRCGSVAVTDETGIPRHTTAWVVKHLIPEAFVMRGAQCAYYRTKSVDALNLARDTETRVDQMLSMFSNPENRQQRLF